MFQFRQSKVTLRKEFKQRRWSKSESMYEFVHYKVILGNKISIPDNEMLEYIIKRNPDVYLRDQTRIQSFANLNYLLKAFKKITLSDRSGNTNNSIRYEKRRFNQRLTETKQQATETQHQGDRRNVASIVENILI